MIDSHKNYLDYDWLRSNAESISPHPNGFIQISYGSDRIHVFSRYAPRQRVPTPGHNHSFGFHSDVILGIAKHAWLVLNQDKEGGPTHRLHDVVHDSSSNQTILSPAGEGSLVRVDIADETVLGMGDSYDFEPEYFHETIADNTVTVMRKTSHNPRINPQVLVPVGIGPDNDFNRQGFPDEFLWSVVNGVLSSD